MNQLNWNATVFAADAAVNGRRSVLADGLGRHLARFTARRGVGRAARELRAGPAVPLPARALAARAHELRLARVREHRARASRASTGRRARRACRRRVQLGLLRDWVRRAISGYWTHAGALNWDTGLGYHRWQQSKKVALAQGALLGVATAPELQPDPRWGEWAKWLLDRGLVQLRRADRARGPDPGRARARRERRPAESRQRVPRRRAARRQRDARAAGRPRPRASGRAARAVRVRPGHRPPRRDHAPRTARRSSPSTTAPSRTAASTSPASSAPTARSSARSAGRGPRASGCAWARSARSTAAAHTHRG